MPDVELLTDFVDFNRQIGYSRNAKSVRKDMASFVSRMQSLSVPSNVRGRQNDGTIVLRLRERQQQIDAVHREQMEKEAAKEAAKPLQARDRMRFMFRYNLSVILSECHE